MKRLFLSLLLGLILYGLSGQTISIFDLLQQDSTVDIMLKLDWKTLGKKKRDKAYLPAHLKFIKGSNDTFSVDLKVRARGHMRLDICYFPPLKLKFDKNDLAQRALAPHNEIDLVHRCQGGEQYNQFILREYLAYKLYQELSPYSFRVQLVRIHYQNEDGTIEHDPSIGFLVENSEELVDRLGARRNKIDIISKQAVDPSSLLHVCLFEYMIGNTDWFIQNRHNLEFIAKPGIPLLVPVPFDFDYSGLVGAPYAAHHESIKLPSVAQRYYQGRCAPEEDVLKKIEFFIEKKETILGMVTQIPGLNQVSMKHIQGYLQDFFDIIENPKKTEHQILRHCDMWPAAN